MSAFGKADISSIRILPYLQVKLPIRSFDAITDSNLTPSLFPASYSETLTDLQFENLVNDVYFYNRNKLESLAEAEKELMEIVEMIQEEVE